MRGGATSISLNLCFPTLIQNNQLAGNVNVVGVAQCSKRRSLFLNNQFAFPGAVAGIVNNIATEILTLAGSGAKNFVIVNVPNVGATPRVQALGPAAAAGATGITMAINQGLLQALTSIGSSNPSLNLQLLDLYGIGNMVAANPLAYGFTNTKDACLTETTLCSNPNQYLYWDSFHPTAAVGRLVAAIYIPEPSTLLLLLLPIAALGLSKRKSR